LAEEKPSGL
jgi:arginyl-tRNA--protein-N-Asp/Glu arginylyltransferase